MISDQQIRIFDQQIRISDQQIRISDQQIRTFEKWVIFDHVGTKAKIWSQMGFPQSKINAIRLHRVRN
jgi:hypothetical protein